MVDDIWLRWFVAIAVTLLTVYLFWGDHPERVPFVTFASDIVGVSFGNKGDSVVVATRDNQVFRCTLRGRDKSLTPVLLSTYDDATPRFGVDHVFFDDHRELVIVVLFRHDSGTVYSYEVRSAQDGRILWTAHNTQPIRDVYFGQSTDTVWIAEGRKVSARNVMTGHVLHEITFDVDEAGLSFPPLTIQVNEEMSLLLVNRGVVLDVFDLVSGEQAACKSCNHPGGIQQASLSVDGQKVCAAGGFSWSVRDRNSGETLSGSSSKWPMSYPNDWQQEFRMSYVPGSNDRLFGLRSLNSQDQYVTLNIESYDLSNNKNMIVPVKSIFPNYSSGQIFHSRDGSMLVHSSKRRLYFHAGPVCLPNPMAL